MYGFVSVVSNSQAKHPRTTFPLVGRDLAFSP